MRETRTSGSEGGGANSIDSPYPYRLTLKVRSPGLQPWVMRQVARGFSPGYRGGGGMILSSQAAIVLATSGLTEAPFSWAYSSTSPVVAGTSR